jgi:phage shock protein PspC (stress-responsive transcriptional regulator)
MLIGRLVGMGGASRRERGYPVAMTNQTLVRPQHDRAIAGVCSAIARRFDLSPTLVRVLAVLGVFFFGWTIPVYVAFWIVIPNE